MVGDAHVTRGGKCKTVNTASDVGHLIKNEFKGKYILRGSEGSRAQATDKYIEKNSLGRVSVRAQVRASVVFIHILRQKDNNKTRCGSWYANRI